MPESDDIDITVTVQVPIGEWEAAVEESLCRGGTLTDAIRDFLRKYVAADCHRRSQPTPARCVVLSGDELRERYDVDRLL